MTLKCLEYKVLRNIVSIEKGKPPVQQPYFGKDAELYLTPEYLRGRTSAESVKPSINAVRVEDGDTIILWDGSNAGEVFRARKGILSSTMSLLNHDDSFGKDYFLYATKYWETFLKGQTSGSGIPHVDKDVLGKVKIIQFDKPEQTKISRILSTVDRAIKQMEAVVAKQQRIKVGLMQDLLTLGIDEQGNLRSELTHQFKDSPLGRIPVEWEIKRLDDCVRKDSPICYGILMPGTGFDNGVPVIKVKDIIGGKILQTQLLLTDPQIDNQYKRSKLHVGDLLVTIRGTTGRVALVPQELDMANITQDTARIRFKEEHLNIFFYFLFQGKIIQDQILLNTLGQAVKGINIAEVRNISFGMPQKKEQEEIAKRLIEFEESMSKTHLYLQKLILIKTALMQDLLTGKKRVTALLDEME